MPTSEADTVLAELSKEAHGEAMDALASIRGRFRAALQALADHGAAHGGNVEVIMAGLLGQLQAELNELRTAHNLPDLSTAADAQLAAFLLADIDIVHVLLEQAGINHRADLGILGQGIADTQVLDAALIAAAQAVEHYEMTRYGTLIAWAKQLGRNDCAAVLQQNLKEEQATDKALTSMAEGSINLQAAE